MGSCATLYIVKPREQGQDPWSSRSNESLEIEKRFELIEPTYEPGTDYNQRLSLSERLKACARIIPKSDGQIWMRLGDFIWDGSGLKEAAVSAALRGERITIYDPLAVHAFAQQLTTLSVEALRAAFESAYPDRGQHHGRLGWNDPTSCSTEKYLSSPTYELPYSIERPWRARAGSFAFESFYYDVAVWKYLIESSAALTASVGKVY
jgi:hypothetical protein